MSIATLEKFKEKFKMPQTIIGARIKKLRKGMGLTQEALGSMIGVTGSSISQYEKGMVNIGYSEISKLAEALQVDPNYLMATEAEEQRGHSVSVGHFQGNQNAAFIGTQKGAASSSADCQMQLELLQIKYDAVVRERDIYLAQIKDMRVLIEDYKNQVDYFKNLLSKP